MLTEERHGEILKILQERPAVTVQELTEILDTSESTIRRDLTALHNLGKLNKVHGGATSLAGQFNAKDDTVTIRQRLNWEEKCRIGEYAAALVGKDDFIYVDAGTSTQAMIQHIEERRALYVTNGILHARHLAQRGCRVFVLGGEIKPATEAVVGSEALDALRKYNFTKGFFGANGVTAESGYSTPDVNEAMVKAKAMARCGESYVLCDPAKVGRISPVTFAPIEAAVLITTKLEHESLKGCTEILEVDL
ncbi:DeoR/GlpR family DNA-binding transcription regulator [Gehongia tenuis]|uniref:DeoR/GlpR transcriptional regulator n=1 Tax=Gehongia tenuis TaxID=2763655 RepID=A0A926HP87_9FIRM|nr:DeoR/GlpR family DNA-binding transcription regulator [Gehongia tenuis]MBC8530958.1 DeoR/GlpR transcriptional regulator [Gehongia tenuis]